MIQLNIYTKYSVDLIIGMELVRVVITQNIGKVMENQSTTREKAGNRLWEYE